MNWTLLGLILTIVFFISTIVLSRRLAKKQKPAWAHNTAKVIGLGSDAPPELKMSFAGIPITNVYRTIFIFLNKGNETIPQANVTETIAVHFKGAQILREPTILATSRQANKVSVGQSTKDGDSVVTLEFLYLYHDDGVVVEVLHTESQHIRCSGNIMGTDKIDDMGQFVPPRSERLLLRFTEFIAVGSLTVVFIALALVRYKLGMGGRLLEYVTVGLGGLEVGSLFGGWEAIWHAIQSVKFPAWSIPKKQ